MATMPRFIVISWSNYDNQGYARRKEETDVKKGDKKNMLVALGEESALSTLAKIEIERAKVNRDYVHLRFCKSNKYWARQADKGRFIVAESNKPEEDTSKPSCTLFKAAVTNEDEGLFNLTHVQSGGRVSIDETTMAFLIEQKAVDPTDELASLIEEESVAPKITNPLVSIVTAPIDLGITIGVATVDAIEDIVGLDDSEKSELRFVDWDTLVKLPKNVAFKGYNDEWLGGILSNGVNYLQFSVDDPNTPITTYKIQQLPDGHVRIYSNFFEKYCRRSDSDWIVTDSSDATYEDDNSLFWPVKVNDTTIALRNVGNKQFCVALDFEEKTRCLNASAKNITKRAQIVTEELVMGRKIYDVRYRMEDSRIFNEQPFVAGSDTAFNFSDQEAGIEVEVEYANEKSYSFSRSLSLSAGFSTSFEIGIPLIAQGTVEVSFGISTTMDWNTTTTTVTTIKATGKVPVPPRSKATVTYVGTKGTCDVPFSYTQQDKRSTDGKIIYSDLIDGVYRGINAYNFSFVIDKTEPL